MTLTDFMGNGMMMELCIDEERLQDIDIGVELADTLF
jgi:hypothetical protein